jgi:CheY-like chemotaxis protein
MTSAGEYILLVEDDLDARDSLTMVLEGMGHSVVCASNGREAIDQLQREPQACLILLDLMMPIMNGWEFRTLQKSDPRLSQIPTIVLSALNDPDKLPNSDVVAYFVKPIIPEDLLATVDQYC